MTQTDQELDRIERSIDIDASAEKVWSLIERPGWWISEHDVDPDPEIRWESDDVAIVVHEKYGEFKILRLESDPPRYVSYRWIEAEDAGTLVEFWIAERSGGVTLARGRERPGRARQGLRRAAQALRGQLRGLGGPAGGGQAVRAGEPGSAA